MQRLGGLEAGQRGEGRVADRRLRVVEQGAEPLGGARIVEGGQGPADLDARSGVRSRLSWSSRPKRAGRPGRRGRAPRASRCRATGWPWPAAAASGRHRRRGDGRWLCGCVTRMVVASWRGAFQFAELPLQFRVALPQRLEQLVAGVEREQKGDAAHFGILIVAAPAQGRLRRAGRRTARAGTERSSATRRRSACGEPRAIRLASGESAPWTFSRLVSAARRTSGVCESSAPVSRAIA